MEQSLEKARDVLGWNWPFTNGQVEYMAEDVLYLGHLFDGMLSDTTTAELLVRYEEAMVMVLKHASLEVEGFEDLLSYKQTDAAVAKDHRKWWKERVTIFNGGQ